MVSIGMCLVRPIYLKECLEFAIHYQSFNYVCSTGRNHQPADDDSTVRCLSPDYLPNCTFMPDRSHNPSKADAPGSLEVYITSWLSVKPLKRVAEHLV
jgi:hypothetical protein